MAIETWEYRIDVAVAPAFYKRDTETFTITRVTNPSISDMSVYELVKGTNGVARGTLSYGWYSVVWKNTVLRLGSLITTDTIPRNTENHQLDNIGCTISDSILSIGSTPYSITAKVDGTTENQNTLLLYNRQSFTVRVQVMAKAAVATINEMNTSAYLGKLHTVTLSESAGNGVTYTVKWTMGSNTHEEVVSSGNEASWIISSSWVNSLAGNAQYADGKVTVITKYNEEEIGRKEYPITIYVGTVGAPEVTLSVSKYNDKTNNFGGNNYYIQGMTGLKVTATASSTTDATIESYRFSTSEDTHVEGSSNVLNINVIKTSGPFTVYVTVVDSRGKETQASKTISVFSYNKPTISSPTAMRCSRRATSAYPYYEYVLDSEGAYAVVKASANIATVGSQSNSLTLKAYIKESSSQSYTTSMDLSNGVEAVFDNYMLESPEDKQYYIKFEATDSIGGRSEYEMQLSSASYSIHVRNGGLGVAIGQIADGNSQFQVSDSWTPMWGSFMIPRIVYHDPATEGTPEPIKKKGLIWLKPKS